MFGVLLRASWRRHRRLRWSLTLGLGLWELLLAVTYETFGTGSFSEAMLSDTGLSRTFQAVSGSTLSILSPEGWLGFGWMHPLALVLMVVWVTACATTAVAREVEEGTIEFLASRPVDRRMMLGARITAWAGGMAMVLAGGTAGTVTGVFVFDSLTGFSLRATLLLPLAVTPMLVVIAGMGFLATAGASARSRVQGVVAGFTLVSYFLNFAAGLWDPIEPAGPLSLFHYVSPGEWARDGIQWGPALVLPAIGLVLMAMALVVVDRRDFAA